MVNRYRNTANLTSESRTKLAQAKSKGLTHTLISEALNLDKGWDEIKDLLHLKLCNLDIHTSVGHFMEIQQNNKESLAVYINRFKWEAKRCNFHNNAAMIQLFIKGLKNTHTLALHVYEKKPQTLVDAISEVEKLQTAQQLTTTLLPSSTVNMMSSEDNKCFQCQESGHIACHCPHIQCFDCNEYGNVAADCPDKIPPSGTPACHKKHHSHARHHTRSSSRLHHRDRHGFSRSRSQSHTQISKPQVQQLTQKSLQILSQMSSQDHHCIINNPVFIIIDATHHTEGPHHIEVPQLIPEITADLDHILHTDPVEQHLLNLHPVLAKQHQKHQDRKYKRVTIDDPQSDYYSLDDASSDSDDDLN